MRKPSENPRPDPSDERDDLAASREDQLRYLHEFRIKELDRVIALAEARLLARGRERSAWTEVRPVVRVILAPNRHELDLGGTLYWFEEGDRCTERLGDDRRMDSKANAPVKRLWKDLRVFAEARAGRPLSASAVVSTIVASRDRARFLDLQQVNPLLRITDERLAAQAAAMAAYAKATRDVLTMMFVDGEVARYRAALDGDDQERRRLALFPLQVLGGRRRGEQRALEARDPTRGPAARTSEYVDRLSRGEKSPDIIKSMAKKYGLKPSTLWRQIRPRQHALGTKLS